MNDISVLEDMAAEIKTVKDTRNALCVQGKSGSANLINKRVSALEERLHARFPGSIFLSFFSEKKRDGALKQAPKNKLRSPRR